MMKLQTALALGVALASMGCSDLTPGGVGHVDVTLRQTDAVVTQAVGGWAASVVGTDLAAAAVDPDTVEALSVRVIRIDFLPVTGDEEDEASWVSLELPEAVILDLLALPDEGESPLTIASGDVEAGEYAMVRLFTDSAAIRFKGAITVGQQTFEAGVDHEVTIPSGEQTGLKTDAGFTVVEDAEEDVHLLFSSGSTFQNITATGNGRVMLAPVIRGIPDEE